jgi:lipopolysaccharide biosynthesis protein
MTDTRPWLEIGDYALHWGGACGAPTLVVSAAREASHCIPVAAPPAPQSPQNNPLRMGVHLHAFYVESCTEILQTLRQSLPHAQLLITTDSEYKKANLAALLKQHSAEDAALGAWTHSIVVTPNQGRNVLPLLREGWPGLRSCELVLHLHTKQTPHQSFGERWSRELITTLAGTAGQVNAVAAAFAADPQLGIVIPRPCEMIRPYLHWGANFELACWISQALWPERQLSIEAPLVFPAGMMFWFRPSALEPLIEAEALLQIPPQEPVLHDGTSLHALERLTLHACEVAGYQWRYVGQQPDQAADAPNAAHTARANLSVWATQPEAYREGIAALAQQHRQLKHERQELEHRRAELEHRRAELEHRRAELEEQLANYATDLAACSQAKTKLEQELLAMRQSLSWRLMGPARRSARLLRRLAG